MPGALRRSVCLSLLIVLAVGAFRGVRAQRPDGSPWPAASAQRDGVLPPRVLRDVKPQYTAEAMRQKIEGSVMLSCVVGTDGTVGDVRVLKSLDGVFGLDDEAVKAARQWRFTPGTKEGVPVPVLITIQLSFVLSNAPAALVWPEQFPAAEAEIDTSGWIEETSDVAGLQIRVTYPNNWAMRKDAASNRVIYLQSAGGRAPRIVFVEKPRPTRIQIGQGLNTLALERLADAAKQGMTTATGTADVKAIGQMRVADRFWLWYDLWMSSPDPASPPTAASMLAQTIAGSRMWTFITTVGSQEIAVGCVVLYPKDISEADMQTELRRAGAEFSAMLKRVSIQPR
jgi:TonB family protein